MIQDGNDAIEDENSFHNVGQGRLEDQLVCVVELKVKIQKAHVPYTDFPPTYNIYLDGGDFYVSTSIHIKQTIQGSDAHQVFNASPTSVLLDT